MKKFLATTCAVAFGALVPIQATAQVAPVENGPPLAAGESATEYAVRVNACGGAELLSATFAQGGSLVQARCASAGMGIGASPAAAAAAAAGAGALLIIAIDGSSSTTTSQ
ncbi:hypothetical protein FIU86_08090 [Roseovarius sp. THAF9]|uniref:hypothetical protein n=1 Tax=Roseovarius sp. THAF9 TaxID=2587847 RepID=UPI0012687373|nr:hypothetical protein [Roseovarius sp. THAF9]QFT92801.1 hypothetical protein FIU86_08090 [Roseovarius sp. THAF9]